MQGWHTRQSRAISCFESMLIGHFCHTIHVLCFVTFADAEFQILSSILSICEIITAGSDVSESVLIQTSAGMRKSYILSRRCNKNRFLIVAEGQKRVLK